MSILLVFLKRESLKRRKTHIIIQARIGDNFSDTAIKHTVRFLAILGWNSKI